MVQRRRWNGALQATVLDGLTVPTCPQRFA
jgi:hypothetical protein